MKHTKHQFYTFLLCICLFLLCSSFPFQLISKNPTFLVVLSGTSRIIFVLVCFFLVKSSSLFSIPKRKKISHEIVWFLPFFLACGSNFFVTFFYRDFSFQFSTKAFFLTALYYLCVAVSEEVLFRFVIVNYLKEVFSPFKTILYSSTFFSLMHVIQLFNGTSFSLVLSQCIYTFGLGILLSWMYLRVSNLLFPILFHFLFNAINDGLFSFVTGNVEDVIYYLINLGIAIVFILYGIFLYCYLNRKDAKQNVT